MHVYMQLARIKFLLTFIDSEQWQEMMITHYKRSRSISERCCRTFSASYRTTSEQIPRLIDSMQLTDVV